MKSIYCVIVVVMCSLTVISQNVDFDLASFEDSQEPRSAISVGFLMGGGSLIGADFSTLITDQFGFQIGAGLVGFGAGLNFHIKPSVRSSMLSLQYYHQGFGDSFMQSFFGPSFVFRGKRWFSASLGFAFVIEHGPSWPSDIDKSDALITFSIGAYFPL